MNANKATAFELLDFLHPLINLATIQSLLFIYCFLDFELQHSPLAKFICYVYASLKTPSKNQVGKKGRRKEYITSFTYVAHVASLKILHEKTQWEKTHQRKKSTTVDVVSVLRDRPVIFGITVMGCSFRVGLPLNPATL